MTSAESLAVWSAAWPYITAAITLASALDAVLPQPTPGSHWLVIRKGLSFIAVNVGNASNGKQPDFLTWVLRIVTPVLQAKGIIPAAPAPLEEPIPAPATPSSSTDPAVPAA